jgi:hypothetical protein
MDQTLEVRWFCDGSLPESVVDWFMGFDPEKQPDREDLYLISDDPSLNVKLRGGHVQLKRRSGDQPAIRFCERVEGRREYWQKWSFPLTDDAPHPFADDPLGVWLPVEKSRYQREYGPGAQRRLFTALDEEHPAMALVELTQVVSGPHEAWTICVEAKGDLETLPGTLRQVGRYIFGQGTPPALGLPPSYGYVRWLEHIYQDEAVPIEIG